MPSLVADFPVVALRAGFRERAAGISMNPGKLTG
jgi:hypothetical protein